MPWNYEGIAFYMRDSADGNHVALLRAWNGSDHFYTTSASEYAGLPASYAREGISGYISPAADADHVPLYRMYHPGIDDHLYTANRAEYDNATAVWQREGIAGYVVPPNLRGVPAGHRPVFRAYHPGIGDHFYSLSATEMRAAGAIVRTFAQPYRAFPHVGRLVGEVIRPNTDLDRGGVAAALASGPFGDVRGRVDFVICYNANGGSLNHAGENFNFSPRPLRGIIQHLGLRLDPDAQLPNVGGISALAHEVFHHWFAFNGGRATVETEQGSVNTPTSEEVWRALNQGLPYPPFPMIGRQDAHFTPFFDDASGPMEGGTYGASVSTPGTGPFGLWDRLDQVTCLPRQGPTFTLPGPGGGVVNTNSAYSIFDRWLMGDWKPPVTGPLGKIWPSFRVVEPGWVFPIAFEAGLYAELEDGRRFYLGFRRGPHQIGVSQSNGSPVNPPVQLGTAPYDPHEVIGLRVVQQGAQLAFQMRVWPQRSGCLFGGLYRLKENPNCETVMNDLVPNLVIDQTNADHYAGWRTIHIVDGRAARVGLSSRTLSNDRVYARLSARLCLLSGGATRQVPMLDLEEDIPLRGPLRLADGRLIMPYANTFDVVPDYRETADVHQAPKWTLVPPGGDFAFGGRVTLESCTVVTWAGQTQPNWTMVGKLRTARFNQFRLPEDPHRSQRTASPPNNTYKMILCLAAREDIDITDEMVADLDLIRRVWEMYFPLIQTRQVDTRLDY